MVPKPSHTDKKDKGGAKGGKQTNKRLSMVQLDMDASGNEINSDHEMIRIDSPDQLFRAKATIIGYPIHQVFQLIQRSYLILVLISIRLVIVI